MMEWIRFALVALLFAVALVVLFISLFGTFRLKYSLNRMHSAAMCDSLVLLLCVAACVVAAGFQVISVKFLLILLIIWCTSPVTSHVFVKAKYLTDENLSKHCDISFQEQKDETKEKEKEKEVE